VTSARDYNAAQLHAGRLTIDHITVLVRFWQEHYFDSPRQGPPPPELNADGMAGPKTIATLDAALQPAPFLACPLPVLADGRRAVITSGFRPKDRPDHNGCDWFYQWVPADVPNFTGDHGAEGRNADGTPRWVVPVGVIAVAAAAGVVTFAGRTVTGGTVWVDHGNGLRTGYFHLIVADVHEGQRVATGDRIGPVGDNPRDTDGRHLHFELSPVGSYSPMDPEPYLIS
jgi:murein DD-endopeptidase MepM/ murein hydrolase activator NlpD